MTFHGTGEGVTCPAGQIGYALVDQSYFEWLKSEQARRAAEQSVRRGWCVFLCEQCGLVFALPSRDHASPSAEDCPVCRANLASWEMQPIRSWPDPELKVDGSGNLLNGGL